MRFRAMLCAGILVLASAPLARAAGAAIGNQVAALSSENFEQRRASEAALRAAICDGQGAAVRDALTAALEAEGASEELKHRGAALLEACEGGAIAGGLRARLIVASIDKDAGLVLSPDARNLPKIVLRITNLGAKEIQVPRSSYECYRFFKLKIERIGEDGKREPVPAYFDLYPTKDMKMPSRVYETLAPGAHLDRDMDTLLRQGFLMQTLSASQVVLPPEIRKAEFGAMRKPGTYEVSGAYAAAPTELDGKPCNLFERDVGRKEDITLWEGPEVTSQKIELEVTGAAAPAK